MPYVAGDLLCLKCRDMNLSGECLTEYLDRVIGELESEDRVSEETYRARISVCASCPNRWQATCRLCGCYCQIRASIRKNRCPIPGNPGWIEEIEEETESGGLDG